MRTCHACICQADSWLPGTSQPRRPGAPRVMKYSEASGPISEMITEAALGPIPGFVISRSRWRPQSGALERSSGMLPRHRRPGARGHHPALTDEVPKATDTNTGSAGNLPWPGQLQAGAQQSRSGPWTSFGSSGCVWHQGNLAVARPKVLRPRDLLARSRPGSSGPRRAWAEPGPGAGEPMIVLSVRVPVAGA